MLIKLHGIFARDYGPEFRIEADTVADAIEGLTRQIGFYGHLPVEQRPITRVVGFDTEESLYQKTEQEEIHLVPAMIGGGGGFTKILIGAALIGLNFALPGIGVGLSAAISSALIGAGIGMILSGVMEIFMGSPSVSKDDQEASKYLGLGESTIDIGTPISLSWGRGPETGHVLAVNIDSTDMIMGTFPAVPT